MIGLFEACRTGRASRWRRKTGDGGPRDGGRAARGAQRGTTPSWAAEVSALVGLTHYRRWQPLGYRADFAAVESWMRGNRVLLR
jgi:hypothetical protein